MIMLHELGDDPLADIAGRLFRLGLIDGRTLTKPRTGHEVMATVMPQHKWRVINRQKFHQVYGAGFDMSRGRVP